MAYYSQLVDCSCVYGDFKKNLKPRKPWKNLKLILNSLNIILMTLFVTGALSLLVV